MAVRSSSRPVAGLGVAVTRKRKRVERHRRVHASSAATSRESQVTPSLLPPRELWGVPLGIVYRGCCHLVVAGSAERPMRFGRRGSQIGIRQVQPHRT